MKQIKIGTCVPGTRGRRMVERICWKRIRNIFP